eukprot:3830728-Rhodomonas_salina.1
MKKLLELAAPEESTSSNRENALGALANLSSCDAAALFSLAHTQVPDVGQGVFTASCDGGRSVGEDALIMGASAEIGVGLRCVADLRGGAEGAQRRFRSRNQECRGEQHLLQALCVTCQGRSLTERAADPDRKPLLRRNPLPMALGATL